MRDEGNVRFGSRPCENVCFRTASAVSGRPAPLLTEGRVRAWTEDGPMSPPGHEQSFGRMAIWCPETPDCPCSCQSFANTDLLHQRGVIPEQIFLGHNALRVPMPQGRHRQMVSLSRRLNDSAIR
jgi:hypothetical protein